MLSRKLRICIRISKEVTGKVLTTKGRVIVIIIRVSELRQFQMGDFVLWFNDYSPFDAWIQVTFTTLCNSIFLFFRQRPLRSRFLQKYMQFLTEKIITKHKYSGSQCPRDMRNNHLTSTTITLASPLGSAGLKVKKPWPLPIISQSKQYCL